MKFSIHPNVYATHDKFAGLRSMLEDIWVRSHTPGDGTLYIISGFANFNGGARFYRSFKEHTEAGGRIVAFLGGSTSQRLSSKNVVEALLDCNAEVTLVNRKRLLHAKCYRKVTSQGQSLVVTSGNFTGPGMAQNVEASISIGDAEVTNSGFNWPDVASKLQDQSWLTYHPSLNDLSDPAWTLLYDETPSGLRIDETEELTLLVTLGHADTARIQAAPGTNAGKGSQYFWISKDSFDFFPPLTIRNERGIKGTLSALITMHYPQLETVDTKCRVTFEAENNLDFRLGTGRLRYTGIAAPGDLACISRIGEDVYELRIIGQDSSNYDDLRRYATSYIGHQGKQYGYIDNPVFERITGVRLRG